MFDGILLAVIVFGILFAIAVVGLFSSTAASTRLNASTQGRNQMGGQPIGPSGPMRQPDA